VVNEKRLTITEVASKEAEARYGIMTTAQIARRQTLARFLGILGMNHSQEEVVLDAERLGALGEPLQAAEKDIREGMGLRASRKKGEWKIGNTMDIIKEILDEWGAVKTETTVSRHRASGKIVRNYSLSINQNNSLWDKISNHTVNYNENLIKL
jgi:hypothetical protein